MAAQQPEPVTVDIDGEQRVSALLQAPQGARLCYVLAHGAGVGMKHRAMEDVATGLAERGIATFRYQFPYMERGSKRPDAPALCHATVRAAVAEAARLAPALALVAGGRSFGGRMTSQAQAAAPLPGVRGLAFLAFPLHPAGRPSTDRAKHLFNIKVPMLFLQGTRDALADLTLLRPLCEQLGSRATLELFEDADHSFHVPARSGRAMRGGPQEPLQEAPNAPRGTKARNDADVRADVLDAFERWAAAILG
jgi:predicted alpha/beta-hydrolase family hydrolase